MFFLLVTSVQRIAAQTIRLSVQGGVNGINMTSLNNGLPQSNTLSGQREYNHSLMEIHGGLFADVSFKWFTIQTGGRFIIKGGKNEAYYIADNPNLPYSSRTSTEELTLNYIEVPLNFLVKIPLYAEEKSYSECKLFFGGGPFVDLGLSANDKSTVLYNYVTSNTETRDNNKPKFGTDIKNPGYGINALGGVVLRDGLMFSLGYSFGLTNISTNSNADARLRSFNISTGYYF